MTPVSWFLRRAAGHLVLAFLFANPAYRRAWSRRLSGPGGPSSQVWIAGRSYKRADTCKRHDCGDNRFEVLFAPGDTRAVGVLRQPGRARIFGSPSAAERRALLGI